MKSQWQVAAAGAFARNEGIDCGQIEQKIKMYCCLKWHRPLAGCKEWP